MEKEKNLISDEELEKIGGGYTVEGSHEICDQFELIPNESIQNYPWHEYHCKDCVHYVSLRLQGMGLGKGRCDIK